MATSKDIFLYYLWDKDGKSYVVKPDGSVDLISSTSSRTWLKHKPIGWQDLELKFDVVDKYFSNVKALSVPLQYVLDGAQILRYLLYKGKGYEEEVYCVIFKLNTETDIHELEYRGRIDLSTAVDDPEIGVTVNAKEGGFQADLDANEDVTEELPLDGTNPDALNILFDGVYLQDKYNYEFYEADLPNYANTVGIVYLNNEGDSIGVAKGDQSIENAVGFDFTNSPNTPFYSVKPLTTVTIDGSISFNFQDGVSVGTGDSNFAFIIRTATQQLALIPQATYHIPGNVFKFTLTFDLPANERMYLVWITDPLEANGYKVQGGRFSLSFTSINDNSYAFGLQPLAIANQLVKKWNPKYSVVSNFLSVHNNIVATSGQSLRNLAKAVVKYSFTNFWTDYNTQYCLCMNIIGDVMYIEKRDVRFASNSNNVVFDLRSLSKFTLSPDAGKIVNTIKLGWPDQKYDERNGKFEYNSTTEYRAPVTKKAELNLVSNARGDGYGDEFIRGKLNNKDTTDNQGDNEVILVNIVPETQITDSFLISWTFATKTLTLSGRAGSISLFPVGKVFETVTTQAADFNYFIFTVVSATPNGSDLDIVVKETAPAVTALFTGSVLFPCKLKRVRYDDITGVPVPIVDGVKRSDLPGAPFNIEEMRIYDRFNNWRSWFSSIFFQLPTGKMTFQTSLKNAELKTVLNGKTTYEKADIQISSLGAPFFLNYIAKFTIAGPMNFYQVMSNLNAAGVVKGNYHGFDLEFIPVGKMVSKPATNEALEWELLLSANNDLNTLYQLQEDDGLYINFMNNTLRLSILNPVHFVYYNKQLNARYKYKDMFDDWIHNRNDQFAVQPAYLQKWELTDTIKLQAVTNGMEQLNLYIYDASAHQVEVIPFDIVSNPAVRSPLVLSQCEIEVSNYDEGNYLFVIKSGTETLLISEWQSFAEVQYGTYIIDYYNSYNKLNAYFASFRPMIRVEAMWGVERFEATSNDYKDESHLQTLGFDTDSVKTLHFGNPYGVPDWMHAKINSITLLDRTSYEGDMFVRPSDSKWEINERNGYPLNTYAIDLRRSNKTLDIAVGSTGIETEPTIIYTLDSASFGQSAGVLEIEVEPD